MTSKESGQGNAFRIRVKETLDSCSAAWFDGLTVLPQENGETILVGRFADQPAFRGFLDQLWNLNLSVLSVESMEGKHNRGTQT